MLEPTEEVQASYGQTHNLSVVVVEALQKAGSPIGYGILACALTIARLSHPSEDIGVEKEIQFVQDLTDWVGAYWGEGYKMEAN